MSRIVVHHAHHADEGIYRLVHAEPIETTFTEMEEDKEKTITTTIYVNHQDIVWADDDERWQGRQPNDIAAEQRQIVKDLITQRVVDREKAELAVEQARTDIGEVGLEL